MKSLLTIVFTTLATLICLSHSVVDASPPVILQKGEAKAERVLVFSGIAKPAPALVAGNVIMDQERLKVFWKRWKIGKIPEVDFEKQVLTVATWSGSRIDMARTLDEEGNLVVVGAGGTKDLVDGITYHIEVYTLTGVKTVNGRNWPEPKSDG